MATPSEPAEYLGPHMAAQDVVREARGMLGGDPRLRLSEVDRDGPGWEAGLRYANGVWLGVWRPRVFARFNRSRFGRLPGSADRHRL